MFLTQLKKIINQVAEINDLKLEMYYSKSGGKRILERYTRGEDINILFSKVVTHIDKNIVTFLYKSKFTKWDFWKNPLTVDTLDKWLNLEHIIKPSPLEDVTSGLSIMDLDVIEEEDLNSMVEDFDIEDIII